MNLMGYNEYFTYEFSRRNLPWARTVLRTLDFGLHLISGPITQIHKLYQMYNSINYDIGNVSFPQFYPSYYTLPSFNGSISIPNPCQFYLQNCPQNLNILVSPEKQSPQMSSQMKKEDSHNGTHEENISIKQKQIGVLKSDQKKQKNVRPKKNVESNISNQVFSYLTSQKKSKENAKKILKNNGKKVQGFFEYMSCLSKYKRKYLSRKYLGELCIMSPQCPEYNDIKSKYPVEDKLTFDEFRSTLSTLIFHFLREKCVPTILTSSKMSSELRREHMERKREILLFLEEYVRPDLSHN